MRRLDTRTSFSLSLAVDQFFFAKISFQLIFPVDFKSTSHIFDIFCGNFYNFNFTGLFTDLDAPRPVGFRLTVRFSSSSDDHIHN